MQYETTIRPGTERYLFEEISGVMTMQVGRSGPEGTIFGPRYMGKSVADVQSAMWPKGTRPVRAYKTAAPDIYELIITDKSMSGERQILIGPELFGMYGFPAPTRPEPATAKQEAKGAEPKTSWSRIHNYVVFGACAFPLAVWSCVGFALGFYILVPLLK